MIRAGIAATALATCFAPGMAADAAPEARVAPLCDAIRDVVAVGERDWTFASLQSKAIPLPTLGDDTTTSNGVPALLGIAGYTCEVRSVFGSMAHAYENEVSGAVGFYECSRYDLADGGAEAARVAGLLSRCLGIKPAKARMTFGHHFTFRWRDNPEVSVSVMPNGLKNEGLIVEVIADHPVVE